MSTVGSGRGGAVKRVVRIKNMFKKQMASKDGKISSYCDIKLNVIIEANGMVVIGEVRYNSQCSMVYD